MNQCGKYCIILSCSVFPFYFHADFFFLIISPSNILFLHKIVDISVLTWIRSALPVPSGSAHLFGINAGVLFGVKLVLI
jgi:hypothetical protein